MGILLLLSAEKEAMFYEKLDDNYVRCRLCPHQCLIPPGGRGFCRNRKNIDGKLYTLNYGRICSIAIEPVEKAPFYHFLPGHLRLAIACPGCNLRCKYCQNWQISQVKVEDIETRKVTPKQIVQWALQAGVKSICFTYSEPTAYYEFMLDVCKLAKKHGLKTLMVSNGFINPEPLKLLLKYMDGVKIDLKFFDPTLYAEISSGELEPVLRSIKIVKESGKWLEIVNLVVPTINDDMKQIEKMCKWIVQNVGPDVPLHFTRFFPCYKLTNLPPTPVKTLEKAREIAKKVGLKYVYIGNVPGHPANSTYCPRCGRLLIKRVHFTVVENKIKNGKCPYCGEPIAGVWK